MTNSPTAYVDTRYKNDILPCKCVFRINTDDERSLVGTGDVDKAAIFNTEGNSVWASSPNFHISPTEMAEVVACYKDNAKAFSSGFHVGGTKYLTIKADERSLYGKQVRIIHIDTHYLGGQRLIKLQIIGESRHHYR